MSKKVIIEVFNLSKDIKHKDLKGNFLNPIPGQKWKIEIEGEFKDMSSQTTLKSLEKQIQNLAKIVESGFKNVNSRLDKVESRLDKVESRLDVLEKDVNILKEDVNQIKSLSTIQEELKNK